MGFIFALPLVLISLLVSTGFIERPTPLRGFASTGLLAALFFVHALAALFSVLLYIVCLFATRRLSPMGTIARISAAVPSIALLVIWWNADAAGRGGGPAVSGLGAYYARYFIDSIPERHTFLFLDNYLVRGGGAGIMAGVFFSFCIIGPLSYMLTRRIISRYTQARPWNPALLVIRETADGADYRPALVLFATSLAC